MATLTFDDEFNSLSLWNGTTGTWYTNSYGSGVSGNGFAPTGEQQWYINNNYAPTASVTPWIVHDGILTITAAPASPNIQPLINGYPYTSGEITTAQSFSQTYGYFEMRAQLPAGQGLWPAFWLLDANGQWPPEVDVLEMLGQDPSVYYVFVHTSLSQSSPGQGNTVPDTSAGYHTYGVDWEPNTIAFYFDGRQVFQTATPPDMNAPMNMIANLALGGWPGDVDPSVLPAHMNIDFIRAYSSLPSWISDGSDPTDVNHSPSSPPPTGVVSDPPPTGLVSDPPPTGVVSDPPPTGLVSAPPPAGVVEMSGSGPVPNAQTVQLTGVQTQNVTAASLDHPITIISNDYGSTIAGGSGNDTLIAGHNIDTLTGGGGSDIFAFNFVPWSAGHITDFTPGMDKINLSGVLSAYGHTGSDPIADGWLLLNSDGAGNTQVEINAHDPSFPYPYMITNLDHVDPSAIHSGDYLFT